MSALLVSFGGIAADARPIKFDIKGGDLALALNQFAQQSDLQIFFPTAATRNKQARAIQGTYEPHQALAKLLEGTGLIPKSGENDTIVVTVAAAQNDGGAPGSSTGPGGGPSPHPTPTAAAAPNRAAAARQSEQITSSAVARELEVITVTAQRRQERLQDVPMAVTVHSGEMLEKTGTLNINNIGNITSGVLVAYSGGRVQPSFRGVTNLIAGNSTENNIAIYVDGIYQADANAIANDYANIASIEILKGPQGALYGRNATGGAILITTLAPSKTLTGKLEVSYGSFNERKFSGYLSGPINERIRFSLTGYTRQSDGYMKLSDPTTGLPTDQSAAPVKSQTVRLKIEADVTQSLTATVGLNYDVIDDRRLFNQQKFAYLSPAVPLPPLRPLNPSPNLVAYDVPTKALGIHKEVTLKLDLKTGIGVLTSNSAYTKRSFKNVFDSDGTYRNDASANAILPTEVYQTNLNYAIDAIENLDLVVGGDYYRSLLTTKPPGILLYGVNGILTQITEASLKRNAYAFYVDGTYRLTDKVTLGVGGRYAHERVQAGFASRTAAQLVAGTYTVRPELKTKTWNQFTPRASLRYAFTSDSNAYFSFSRGFKSGQWPFATLALAPVHQETISAYEIGYKLAKPEFQFNVSAFYYDYKNIQISVNRLDPTCPPTTQACPLRTFIFNGPRSRIYGIDGDITLIPFERFSIRIGAAYLRARYREFPDATGNGLNITTGTNVGNQTQNWSNQQMARSPTFSGNASVEYDLATSFGNILFSSNVSFTTSYVPTNPSVYGPLAGAALANKQRYRQSAYALLNGQITWTDLSGHFSVTAFGRNLTDKNYFTDLAGVATGDRGTYGWPRVVGVRAGYRF